MNDKDGKPLRAGDRVRVEAEGVVKHDASHDAIEVQLDGITFTNSLATKYLTKIEPEFEWKEDSDFNGNDAWRLFRGPACVRRLFQVVRKNSIAWRRDDRTHTDDYWPTLEAAKAAAEQSEREAG